MRESRTYGSVRGARSNARPYRDQGLLAMTGGRCVRELTIEATCDKFGLEAAL